MSDSEKIVEEGINHFIAAIVAVVTLPVWLPGLLSLKLLQVLIKWTEP